MHWEHYTEVKLRANGTNNHSLWFGSLNNEPANHHVVARLDKGARDQMLPSCRWNNSIKFKGADVARTVAQITTLITRWRIRIVARVDSWTVSGSRCHCIGGGRRCQQAGLISGIGISECRRADSKVRQGRHHCRRRLHRCLNYGQLKQSAPHCKYFHQTRHCLKIVLPMVTVISPWQ